MEICSWTSRLEDLCQFLQGNQASDLFDEVGKGFFDEFQNAADLLDADKISSVLSDRIRRGGGSSLPEASRI